MSEPVDAPEPPPPPRPLMGLGFWALIAFGVLCVLAGAGVAYLAPKLAPAKPSPPPMRSESALPGRISPPSPAPVAALPAATDVDQLNARIASLETRDAEARRAAAAAAAAADLLTAAQDSRPFLRELATLRAVHPDLAELQSLERVAREGAPSRVALAMSFPEFAARAARKARQPKEGADLAERVAYGAARFVTVRRLDASTGPDAEIAAAERALSDGDVVSALKALDRLPAPAKAALAPWRAGAERRAEIDRVTSMLRAHARRAAPTTTGEPSP